MDTNLSNNSKAAVAPKVRTDTHLWGTYILLVLVAVVELFSASIQEVHAGNVFSPVLRHCGFLVAGLVIMLIMQWMHYRYIYGLIPIYVLGSIGLMFAVHFSGSSFNGAQRAIEIHGHQLLPADFLKLAVALGMAWILVRYRERKDKNSHDVSWKGMWYCLLFQLLCAGLLFEHGLSNTIIVMCIGLSTMLIGGMSWKKFSVALLIIGVLGGGAYVIKSKAKADTTKTERMMRISELNKEEVEIVDGDGRASVWNTRIKDHFRPNKSKEKFSAEHAQEQLSHIAQARGGLIGVGIGCSRENARLPLAYSDYIYAIIVEELGLFIALALLGVYLWILGRSFMLTMQFKQTLPAVLAMGCAFTIVFQALYHMAIVSGFFPVSGQPLPFISKGGISVLATSLAFGTLLSVARHGVRIGDSKAEIKAEQELLPDNTLAENPVMVKTTE